MSVTMGEDFPIVCELDVASVGGFAMREAERLGFPNQKAYRLATAVTELANNLLHHAYPGGTIRLDRIEQGEREAIQISAADNGPGIADVGLAMTDGYSTNCGLGAGLPGARRLMDDFSIESAVGVGTRIVARLWRS